MCLQCRRLRFNPSVGKIPWSRTWQLTPVLLPGKSHGQRSLAGYSPCGCKQSDTSEWLTLSSSLFMLLVLCSMDIGTLRLPSTPRPPSRQLPPRPSPQQNMCGGEVAFDDLLLLTAFSSSPSLPLSPGYSYAVFWVLSPHCWQITYS